jgi:hypothetical protein
MVPDTTPQPSLLTRAWWFIWAGWNRVVCATRGHRPDADDFCERCGLPLLAADSEGASK